MKTCDAHTVSSQSQLRVSLAAGPNCILIGCDVARQKWARRLMRARLKRQVDMKISGNLGSWIDIFLLELLYS